MRERIEGRAGRTEEQLLSCLALKWATNSWFGRHMTDGHFLSKIFKEPACCLKKKRARESGSL